MKAPPDHRAIVSATVGYRAAGIALKSLALMLLLVTATMCAAQETVIRVGSEQDFRPYCFTDANGQPTGFGVELLKSVAQKMKLPLSLTAGPWDEVWNQLVSGRVDVLPVVARAPGREVLVDFSLPHTETFDAFFVHAGRAALDDLASAAGKEIVVLRSDAAEHQLIERKFNGKVVPVESIPEGLRLIAAGRHDGMLCSKLVGVLEREQAGIRGVRDGPPIPEYKRTFSFAVRKGNAELLEKLNQGLLMVKTDGTYDQIYRRWLSVEDPWTRWVPYFKWAIAGLVFLGSTSAILQWLVNQRTRELQELNARLEQKVEERTATLRQAQQRLEMSLKASGGAAWGWNVADNQLDEWTAGYRELYGFTPDEPALFESWLARIHPGDRERLNARTQQMLNTPGDDVWNEEFRILHPRHGERWLCGLGRVFRDEAGRVLRMAGVNLDITERRQTQQALRDSQALLSAVLKQLPVGLGVMDTKGQWTVTNSFMDKVVPKGIPSAQRERIGRWRCHNAEGQLVPPENWPGQRALRGEIVSPGLQMLFTDDDATDRWMRVSAAPLRNDAGQIVGATYVVQDIDQVKRAQDQIAAQAKALEAANLRLQGIIFSAMDAVVTIDDQQRIVLFNPAAETMFAFKANEVEGRHFECLIPERFRSAHTGYVDAFGQAGVSNRKMGALGAISGLRSDGEEFPIEASISKVEIGGEKLLTVILRDITERRRAEEDLQIAKETAEAASCAKDHFLAQLSHELRTPLAPVLMAAVASRDDDTVPAAFRDTFAMIARNVMLEARLIDDLLDLTRITRGKLELRSEPCDAHSLVAQAIEIVRDEAREKAVEIVIDLCACHSRVLADPTRLQQVFWNLLRNAVKFTPCGGQVTICSRDGKENRLCIDVCDTGIGFAPGESGRLFEPFHQAGSRSAGDLGLGLAIASGLVLRHHGTIRAESPGPGLGATFTVELPVLADVGPEIADSSIPKAISGDAAAELPMRLLVVEDHEATLQVLSRLLSRAGHHVTTARNALEARAAAGEQVFDAVISDLGLPDGTGIELMEDLRNRHGLSGVALSGYGTEEDVRRSLDAGFCAHLVKPVDFNELRRTLRQIASKPRCQGSVG